MKILLLGGWTNPSEKYLSKWLHLPQIGVNINNIWNHHLVFFLWQPAKSLGPTFWRYITAKSVPVVPKMGHWKKNIQNLRVKGLLLLLKYTHWKINGNWTYSHHPWKERKRIWTKHPGNYVVNLQGCAPKLNLIRLVQRSLRSQAGSCCESFIMETRGQPEIRGLFVLQSFRENCVRTPKFSGCSNLSDHHKMTLKMNDFKEIPRMEYLPTFTINLSQM